MPLNWIRLDAYALFQKAILETDQEHFKESLADLNRVLSLAPYSALAYFNRALLKGKLKDYFGALNDYNKVLSLSPDNVLPITTAPASAPTMAIWAKPCRITIRS